MKNYLVYLSFQDEYLKSNSDELDFYFKCF